jgi:RNA polymerase primary sigma factor
MSARHDRNAELHRQMNGSDPRRAEAARSSLIEENTGLIGNTLKAFFPSLVSDDDAWQDGSLGLMTACAAWDPERGTLGTFARAWIRQAISRGQDASSRTIRLPVHAAQRERTVRMARHVIESAGGEATPEYIEDLTGLSADRIAQATSAKVASLDAQLGHEDDAERTLIGRIGEPDDPPRWEVGQLLDQLYQVLPEREAYVLRRRLSGHNLGDIGADLGVSRETIRQDERGALAIAQHACLQIADLMGASS